MADDLDALLERATAPTGPTVSSFPVAKEDVALVVDAALPAAEQIGRAHV